MKKSELKEELRTFEGFRSIFVENLASSLSFKEAYERTENLYMKFFDEKPYRDHLAFFSVMMHRNNGTSRKGSAC